MNLDRISENERLQIEQIMQLDTEELQIEEVDDDYEPSDDDDNDVTSGRGDARAGLYGGLTFNTCLASLHTYLGEVDDTHGRLAFLEGGAILNLPMFYLEGVVLFPEATLPLKVIQPRFKAAVEKAMNQVYAPCTIGVIQVNRHSDGGKIRFARTGTTAEIRRYRRMDDGTLNVVARGQQRFRLKRCWIDVEGAPCAEVQIVQEDTPLKTPKAAFAQLASVSNVQKCNYSCAVRSAFSPAKRHGYEDVENDSGDFSTSSRANDHSDIDMRMSLPVSDSSNEYGRIDESSSSDDRLTHEGGEGLPHSYSSRSRGSGQLYKSKKIIKDGRFEWAAVEEPSPGKRSSEGEKWKRSWFIDDARHAHMSAMSFWPHWVYEMYDSYSLARRAADLWKRVIIGNPSLDDYIRKPNLLSFHIASKLPMSESTRQELLEIDGISYRLQREIQLLKSFNLVRCRTCQTLIAKRSDMVVMSTDGPVNAYVNPNGYVHEIITVHNASGLALDGSPVEEYSWFPGYAWTITYCAVCEANMGWRFTAVKRNLLPKSFWGIRSSQVTDDTRWE